MILYYLSKDGIDDIKLNYDKYKSHFQDTTNEWFLELFKRNNWLQESKIQVPDIVLNMDDDYNISDRKNVQIVYDALRDLSPVYASDERVWAGIIFCYFWDFIQYRRKQELASGVQKDVLNSFFFMVGTKRSCFVNCISRLWWTGFILYDPDSANPYGAIDTICERAYASNVMLLSSSNFVANKDLILGIMDCIMQRKAAGEYIKRAHYISAYKHLNCLGGISLLDTLTREEVYHIASKQLNKIYGEPMSN